MRAAPRVVIAGGGLAGITAALDCAAAGARVTLLEVRPRLGGAAYSFEREGMVLDNGQHVFLRCCSAYRALLARIGTEHRVHVQRRLSIPVIAPGGRTCTLTRGPLPAPAHLAGALLRYRHLRPRERIRAACAARALASVRPEEPATDQRTLGEWLTEHGQSTRAIDVLWDLVALPTLNLRAADASLALGAFVFQAGLLHDAGAGDIGLHDRPLSEIIDLPARAALRAAGVDVRLGWRGESAQPDGDGFTVLGGPDDVEADAVIVALGHRRAAGLLPPAAIEGCAWPHALGDAPIVNLHVVYDRRVCELPFAAGVDSPVQYVFDRTDALGEAGAVHGHGQYLAVSLSGAFEEMRQTRASLQERFTAALAELFPAARHARIERFLVTREHAATFRAAPGAARVRPPARTAVPGLLLAGSWTDTGWPATLESAVRSGHVAAAAALAHVRTAHAVGVAA